MFDFHSITTGTLLLHYQKSSQKILKSFDLNFCNQQNLDISSKTYPKTRMAQIWRKEGRSFYHVTGQPFNWVQFCLDTMIRLLSLSYHFIIRIKPQKKTWKLFLLFSFSSRFLKSLISSTYENLVRINIFFFNDINHYICILFYLVTKRKSKSDLLKVQIVF